MLALFNFYRNVYQQIYYSVCKQVIKFLFSLGYHLEIIQWKPLNRVTSEFRIVSRITDVISIVRYEFVQKMCPD